MPSATVRWCGQQYAVGADVSLVAHGATAGAWMQSKRSRLPRRLIGKPIRHGRHGKLCTKFRVLTWRGPGLRDGGSRREGNDEMTMGQEESDDLVVPEDGRKSVQSAETQRGGKEVGATTQSYPMNRWHLLPHPPRLGRSSPCRRMPARRAPTSRSRRRRARHTSLPGAAQMPARP